MPLIKEKKNEPLSVYDFIRRINTVLSSNGARIQGEVTSLNLQYSKAIYFSIKDKDNDALLNCMIWRSTYDQNGLDLKVGDEIIVTGTPEIYAPRGTFSLKTQTIEYAGEGALKKAYDELKKKLQKEGLLELNKKRQLPKFPKKIGVITSKAGVVIQDFTSNLGRYGFTVTTVDSRVEGKDAIHDILNALYTMSKQDIEVLVIMRGGGSWESLQPFNTESVVRAVASFKCPVLTGIGHDTDVTLVQMVADLGVSTPTAVAEALNESWDQLISAFNSSKTKIISNFQKEILRTSRNINTNTTKIKSAFSSLEKKISRANLAFQKSITILRSNFRSKSIFLEETLKKLSINIKRRIDSLEADISNQSDKLILAQKNGFRRATESLLNLEKYIKVANPKRNLELGYSLSYNNEKLVRSKKDIAIGDIIRTHLSDGEFTSEIKNI